MLMSNAVDESARTIKGKKALAVESFAKALRQVGLGHKRVVRHSVSSLTNRHPPAHHTATQLPMILADNGGYDSSDLVAQLRAAHYEGQADAGLGRSRKRSSTRQGAHA
jgi:T-complex protein 1 subunit beta